MTNKHNHVTRDIKPPGVCPGCDEYHRSRQEGRRAEPLSRGESGTRGESRVPLHVDAAQCALFITILEETGHGGCADDLEAATYQTAAQVAYDIAEHLEEGCGAPVEVDIDTARALRVWADQHERLVREQPP